MIYLVIGLVAVYLVSTMAAIVAPKRKKPAPKLPARNSGAERAMPTRISYSSKPSHREDGHPYTIFVAPEVSSDSDPCGDGVGD